MANRATILKQKFQNSVALPFEHVLPEAVIQKVLEEQGLSYGKKLGIGDHIVAWQRPQQCPQLMSSTDFEALPASIEVREVHLLIQQPGFRPTEIILVTTLVDPKRYSKAKLAMALSTPMASD